MIGFDFVNIIAAISVILTVTFLVKLVKDIRKIQLSSDKNRSERTEESDKAYKRVLKATYGIEHERQKNSGEKLDETIYINRAETIRTKTPFFEWVNTAG